MITHEEIRENLAKFRLIEPDPAFKRMSRTLVLSSKSEKRVFFGVPLLKVIGAFAVLVIVVTALAFEFSPTPVLSSSFNPNSLQKEFENLPINTQIEETAYREEANQTIRTTR